MSESQSLRDAINSAADGIDWSSTDDPLPAPAGNDTAPDAAQSEGRARDENGRFAKQEGQADAAAAPEDDYEDGIGFERDAWGRLPQDLRPTVKSIAQQRREAEDRAKGYEPIDAALAPVRDAWTMAYGSPDAALRQLIAIERIARENPTEFLRQFAAQRGLDPATIFGQQQAAQPQQQDPIQILRDEARRAAQDELAQAEVTRTLQAFEADTRLEYRADPAVRQAMAALLQSGAAKDMNDAYDQATYAVPHIRAKRTEAEAAERAKQERERNAQAASERQSAAASVAGSPGTTRAPATNGAPLSLREQLSQEWDRQTAARV